MAEQQRFLTIKVKIWDVDTGKCIRSIEGHEGEVTAGALSRDGKWLLSSGRDGTLIVWAMDWELEGEPSDNVDESIRRHES